MTVSTNRGLAVSPAPSCDDGDDDGDGLKDRGWGDVESMEPASAHGDSESHNCEGDRMDESDVDVDSAGEPAVGDGHRDGKGIPYLSELSNHIGRGERVEGGAGVCLDRSAQDLLVYHSETLPFSCS